MRAVLQPFSGVGGVGRGCGLRASSTPRRRWARPRTSTRAPRPRGVR